MKATGALGVGTGIALTTGATAAAEPADDALPSQFDNVGPVTILNAGFSTLWNYSFPAPSDRHVQIAGANILAPFNGARHTALDFGKSNLNGNVTYFVRIRNDGAAAANHNLEGGGLT
jgi:hypothetical protein